jgi:hypothetical protein
MLIFLLCRVVLSLHVNISCFVSPLAYNCMQEACRQQAMYACIGQLKGKRRAEHHMDQLCQGTCLEQTEKKRQRFHLRRRIHVYMFWHILASCAKAVAIVCTCELQTTASILYYDQISDDVFPIRYRLTDMPKIIYSMHL